MHRVLLPPPTLLPDSATSADADQAGERRGRSDADAPASRARLQPPLAAVERRRPLFRPARGWLRRSERAISHFLARHVHHRIPGIAAPYSRQLRRELVLSEATVGLAGLPRAFDGLRVLLLTDVHAGPFVSVAALRQTFERLLRLEPELVLLGGDLATARASEIEQHAPAFAVLRAPLGTFAVLGNHDHYTGEPRRVAARLESLGIEVLDNRSVSLPRGKARLSLAGVDDGLVGRPDLDRALRHASAPTILLSHNPDLVFEAARRDVALMLSGHTHAGQIRVPGLPVLVRQSRYRLDEGRFRHLGTELVVSRGLGAVGLPLRTACPPEAVLLTLRAA